MNVVGSDDRRLHHSPSESRTTSLPDLSSMNNIAENPPQPERHAGLVDQRRSLAPADAETRRNSDTISNSVSTSSIKAIALLSNTLLVTSSIVTADMLFSQNLGSRHEPRNCINISNTQDQSKIRRSLTFHQHNHPSLSFPQPAPRSFAASSPNPTCSPSTVPAAREGVKAGVI